MHRTTSVIARIFATIFVILFVITLVISLLGFTIGQRLFNPNLYKRALEQEQVYTRLPGIVSESITSSMDFNPCKDNPFVCEEISTELNACMQQALGDDRFNILSNQPDQFTEADMSLVQTCMDQYMTSNTTEGPPLFIINLEPEDWDAILTTIITPEELKAMVEDTFDQLFDYFNGKTDTVSISLVKIKERLKGPEGLSAIRLLLSAQPDCTEQENVTFAYETQIITLLFCNPLNYAWQAAEDRLQNGLALIADEIPNEQIIIEPVDSTTGKDSRRGIQLLRLGLRISLLIPGGMLLLVTLFAVRSLKDWLRWWGIPMFVSGILTIANALTIQQLTEWGWSTYVVEKLPQQLSSGLIELVHGLVSFLIHDIVETLVIAAIILIILGLAMWIGSIFIKSIKTQEDTRAHSTEPPA